MKSSASSLFVLSCFPLSRGKSLFWWTLFLAVGLHTLLGEPSLPEGLGGGRKDDNATAPGSGPDAGPAEVRLPEGLGGGATTPQKYPDEEAEKTVPNRWERLLSSLSGYTELRYGQRLQSDPLQKAETVPEFRWQMNLDESEGRARVRLSADFLYNSVVPSHAVDLRRGTGWVDLREAWLDLRPTSFLDLRLGRMIATWGTGDLLFLNDLFPKDWRSFLLGRDVDYLKAPTQGVRAQGYFEWFNFDLLVNPEFAPDRYLDGRQVSFYDPAIGAKRGLGNPLNAQLSRGSETHLRLHRMIGGTETALYFYEGYWKSPGGRDDTGIATFPELRTYGASVRGNVAGGIGNFEFSYYDSREDGNGTDPQINNSQMRYLVGYEREVSQDFTVGVQAYVEQKLDFNAYRQNLPVGFPEEDEYRSVLTLRLTRLLPLKNLELSTFLFYSPTDEDWYGRPSVEYKISDYWTVSIGAGLFGGQQESTFYNQFEDNTNAWISVRWGY